MLCPYCAASELKISEHDSKVTKKGNEITNFITNTCCF